MSTPILTTTISHAICTVAREKNNMIDHDLRRMQSSLEKERRLFAKGGHLAREAHCCLLLAQLYHRLEDLHTAALYTEEAVSLLQHSPSSNPSFLTDVYLGLARLAPDIGQYI